jgi:hypothetical protein
MESILAKVVQEKIMMEACPNLPQLPQSQQQQKKLHFLAAG